MISLVSKNWLTQNLRGIKLCPVREFIRDETLNFKAANNTDVKVNKKYMKVNKKDSSEK